MVDFRIERIPEIAIDGKIIDIGYKLFAILADGTEKQLIYCDIDTLFDYIRAIHNDRVDSHTEMKK